VNFVTDKYHITTLLMTSSNSVQCDVNKNVEILNDHNYFNTIMASGYVIVNW